MQAHAWLLKITQAINSYLHEMEPEKPVKEIILHSGFYIQHPPLIFFKGIKAHLELLLEKALYTAPTIDLWHQSAP